MRTVLDADGLWSLAAAHPDWDIRWAAGRLEASRRTDTAAEFAHARSLRELDVKLRAAR